MDFVCFSQQTPIIFVNSKGRLITSIESNIIIIIIIIIYIYIYIYISERMVLVKDAIDCKVDVAAKVHELNMSMQHWRCITDRERVLGSTNYFF